MNKILTAVLCGAIALLLVSCEKEKEIAVTSVSITQASAEMYIGETVQLSATVLPSDATDKSVTWTSSKQSVATVSSTGKVTAIDEGVSTITASAGGKSSTCVVTVSKKNIAVTSVTLNKSTLELVEGETETLVATVAPADATDKTVKWSSSNPNVATVENGEVVAIAEGSASITATASDKSASCTVTVVKRKIEVESIELNKTSIELKTGESETLEATIKPDDATDQTVTWTTSDEAIAVVDNGEVTALKEGEATITAQAGEKKATCSVVVKKAEELSVTGTASDITSCSVVLSGYANLTPGMGEVKIGIIYSKEENITLGNGTQLYSQELDGNNMYTVVTNDLSSETQYYYKSFVLYSGVYKYGETKSFTTKAVSASIVTQDATDLKVKSSVVHAKLSIDNKEQLYKKVWFIYSQTVSEKEELLKLQTKAEAYSEDGELFYSRLTNLDPGKVYYYIAYAQIHDKYFYGDVNSFETGTFKVDKTTLEFEADGGDPLVVNLTASEEWDIEIDSPHFIASPKSGSGDASIEISAEANPGDERTGELRIYDASKQYYVSVQLTQKAVAPLVADPDTFDGNKRSNTTYELLVYSFADSDGDGIGDFKGIQNKLDYLDNLGVTAVLLSPIHPSTSYHGYDVTDLNTVNAKYGTESDFKNLVNAAHAKGIQVYMDWEMLFTSSEHPWFQSVKQDPENSEYKDYYVLSQNPTADMAAGKIDKFAGSQTASMGAWYSLGSANVGYNGRLHFKLDWTGQKPTVTVTKSTDAVQSSNPNASRWIYYGNGNNVGLYETSSGIHEITIDVATDWGFLVRTSNTSWDAGTKWGGAPGEEIIKFGQPLTLNSTNPGDIVFGSTWYYFASFSSTMPDLNYGQYTQCEYSKAFSAVAGSADKWIQLGVDGFRIDAAVWVYQRMHNANIRFLDQWYQRCNETFKSAGHTDDMFMVAEAWESHSDEKIYYKGVPSCFEFDYGYKVRDVLKGGGASSFTNSVYSYMNDHLAYRADAITSFFLSNHDQDRFASEVNRDKAKMKQAAAILLTGPGKPFFYQGEELGYWGTRNSGDEYVRTPIMWDKAGSQCAKNGVNNKVDNSMLTANISVEAQQSDESSMLQVYTIFSRLRNTYDAFSYGQMTKVSTSETSSIASWYMTGSNGEKFLVLHNTSSAAKSFTLSDLGTVQKAIAVLGTVYVSGTSIKMEGNTSVVFKF